MVDSPSGGAPPKAPRWDLADTKVCGGGIRFSWCSWVFSGYVNTFRRRKYVGGAMRGPRGRGRPPLLGALAPLVASSAASCHPLQVSWITFVAKRLLLKVSFRLDSV